MSIASKLQHIKTDVNAIKSTLGNGISASLDNTVLNTSQANTDLASFTNNTGTNDIITNIDSIDNDRTDLINDYIGVGVQMSVDSTFTDLHESFPDLPILQVDVVNSELIFARGNVNVENEELEV